MSKVNARQMIQELKNGLLILDDLIEIEREMRAKNVLFKKLNKDSRWPTAREIGTSKRISQYTRSNYSGYNVEINYERLGNEFEDFKKTVLEDVKTFKEECESYGEPIKNLTDAMNESLAHLGIDVSLDMASVYGTNPAMTFKIDQESSLLRYEESIKKHKVKREEMAIAQKEKDKREYSELKDKLALSGHLSTLNLAFGENVIDSFEKETERLTTGTLKEFFEEEKNKTMSECKYLALANTLLDARNDFSNVRYAKDAIRSFEVSTDVDKAIYENLITLADSDEDDGRMFRDAECGYSYLFDLAKTENEKNFDKYSALDSIITSF